jgi:hypothetical protein
MGEVLRFERLGHFLTLPVVLDDRISTRFLFDSGIGISLLSESLAKDLGVKPDGRVHTGRRMSGQEVRTSLAPLRALSLGPHRWTNVTVSPIDLGAFSPQLAPFGGILSLGLFEDAPLRVAYTSGTAELLDPERRPAPRSIEVPMRVDHDEPSVAGYVGLRLPDGRVADVEVDTGSDSLILHDRYFDALVADRASVRTVEGTDETGHRYTRRFGTVQGEVALDQGRAVVERDPPAMFQRIIYDGLLGDAFLRRYTVTFEPGRSRLVFEPPAPGPRARGTAPGAARPRAPR